MEICDECYDVVICSCENFCLAPDGGITAGEDYILTLIDKFGDEYTQEITATAYATLCVDVSQFPDGFFNPFAGSWEITLATALDPGTDIQVVYGSISYTCISLRAKTCSSSESVVIPSEDCECFTESMLPSKLVVASADFENPTTYINTSFIGKNQATDFFLWTNEGSGTLVDLTDGFNSFDSTTGTFTIPIGNYVFLKLFS